MSEITITHQQRTIARIVDVAALPPEFYNGIAVKITAELEGGGSLELKLSLEDTKRLAEELTKAANPPRVGVS